MPARQALALRLPRGPGRRRPPRGAGILVLLRLGALAATLLLIREAGQALFASPRFAVRRIEVRAVPALRESLAKELHLRAGTNLLLLNTRRIARQVAALPQVRSVRVSRLWPDRVCVEAEARQAVAVSRAGEAAVFYDGEASPFTIAGSWGWELPELVGPGLAGAPVKAEGPRPAARQLLACLKMLRDQGVKPRQLRMDGRSRVTAELDKGLQVRLGLPRALELKARRLRSVLSALVGKGEAEYIDLSSPYGVVWKPREEPLTPRDPSRLSG